MKSKESYFSISMPFVVENLRRFWAIPVLAFLVYFLSGVFPILMTYSHINDMSDYIKMSLENKQPFYVFAHLMFPIMSGIVIFRYLQGISSVSVMHSMPFTRRKLYNSGFLSGLILILTPIIVNGLILLAISKPAYNQYGTETGMMIDAVNVFSRPDILNWIWVSVLIVVIVYATSVFAGIITGNILMHFATALWFNFLIPGLYGVFIAYFSHYLYGFNITGNWTDTCMSITPLLHALNSNGSFGILSTIYYIATFFVLYALTGFLYQKRKLERATDSLVFGFTEPIICYLVTFLGMTLLGFYFDVLGESDFYIYAGYIAGTIIFFIIGQMIVKKTPRIYNKSSLKSVAVYILIAVIFILGLQFDITGFENRVPNSDKVQGVAISEDFTRSSSYNSFSANSTFYKGSNSGFVMKDPENIKALTAFHKSIADNKTALGKTKDMYSSNFILNYNGDSKFPISRRYNINYIFFKDSKDLKQVYESKEFKNFYSLENLNYEKITDISVNPAIYDLNVGNVQISGANIKEFIACLDKDFKSQSFEDMISLKRSYATVDISYDYKDSNSDEPEKLLGNTITYNITNQYKNTISWLESKGYSEILESKASDIDYIEIVHAVYKEDEINQANLSPDYQSEKVMDKMKITDAVKIQSLLDSYETINIKYDDYYYGIVYLKADSSAYSGSYEKEMYGDYETVAKDTSQSTFQIYFNEGNIPDYITNYFK